MDRRALPKDSRREDRPEDSVELRCVDIKVALGPDDVICLAELLIDWPLSADALIHLLRRPTPGSEPRTLSSGRAGDTQSPVELFFSPSLKQQRNNDNSERVAFGSPEFDLRPPAFPNARVQNAFQLCSSGMVGKNQPGEFPAAQSSIRGYDLPAELGLNFLQSRLPGLDHPPRQF